MIISKQFFIESSKGMPAHAEHERFIQAYYKACDSSQPKDWLDAAMMAKQWECKIRELFVDKALNNQ